MQFETGLTISTALALALAIPAAAQPAAEAAESAEPAVDPTIRPAIDGIFEAFETRPLVGLGEAHGVAQLLDFYRALVGDPRFASKVGNVVVEFGGAAHQDAIDRYVNGESVPYAELRKVWTEVVGWQPTITSDGYARFFAAVRQANQKLPPEQRIKVWLGEPPIDWSQIRTAEDLAPILDTRDSHVAEIILREILGQDRKALVIYGRAHFDRTEDWEDEAMALVAAADPGGPMSDGGEPTLRDVVEAAHPDSFFVAQFYSGFRDADCTTRFEAALADRPMPALAVSVRGTTLERAVLQCMVPAAQRVRFPPSIPEDVQDQVRAIVAANADRDQPLVRDGMLFVAPAAELTVAPILAELALDGEWRAELSRRAEIITGAPMPPDWGIGFPAAPVPYEGRD